VIGYNVKMNHDRDRFNYHVLFDEKAFERFTGTLKTGDRLNISGLVSSSRVFFISQLLRVLPLPSLLIAPNMERAEMLYETLRYLLPSPLSDQTVLFPERDEMLSGDAALSSSPRLKVLQVLSRKDPVLVMASVHSVLQKIQDRESLERNIDVLSAGESWATDEISLLLTERGYERNTIVEKRGQYSLRGCILDIFPTTGEPVRLEFFGDEIESIRSFEIESQRSRETLPAVTILPVTASVATTSILEYFPAHSFIIVEEPSQSKLASLECGDDGSVFTWEELECNFNDKKVLNLSSWTEERIHFATSAIEPFYGKVDRFADYVKEAQSSMKRVAIISSQALRLKEILEEAGAAPLRYEDFSLPEKGAVHLCHGMVPEGFVLEPELVVITDRELLGKARKTAYIVTEKRSLPIRLEDLAPGDFVVHALHGIGVYKGLDTLALGELKKEFITVEYSRGDKLYVPVEQMDLVQKFTTLTDKEPTLSRMGGKEWRNTRARVKAVVREIAERLLALYSERETVPGFAFSPDTPWQAELENSFPFEETKDQAKAIMEVKNDMERMKPMDRLICGDAGYGKTEVALRSAFKAVMDGVQVAVLVPTTILAEQHFTTFSERLATFPVRVAILSRFISPGEQKKIISDINDGKVDVVIGTHRLIQKDVVFKRLGLLIIDEEQHFGVIHKERLKEMKKDVDTLTLTATPIPRTMHLTLSGIRDMSIISTPPENRIPIRTFIFEYQDVIIKGAVVREIERGGQVYFLHNRVRGIELYARKIEKLVPGVRTAVAHGQMGEDELERIMRDFQEGAYDVLVCTTIIESGIDIPNVNTIIINNAYSFGLAQLYQLRGRVGRSHRQAYAYLLYPVNRKLGNPAQKRMEILRDFSELGAGFHIAMKDLEMRGAGNILGTEQSGNVNAVGFDLYCQLLNEAVKELRGEKAPRSEDPAGAPAIDLPISAYLPKSYVPDDRQKITLYKKMASLATKEEIRDLENELQDRFGPLPDEVENLLKMLRLKNELFALNIPRISTERGGILLFAPFLSGGDLKRIEALRKNERLQLEVRENKIVLTGILSSSVWLDRLLDMLEKLKGVISAKD